MAQSSITLGQAIDQILGALESFDEKSRETIISTVCSHLSLKVPDHLPVGPAALLAAAAAAATTGGHAGASNPPRQLDIRALKEQKQPKSAIQMACIVAFFLSESATEPEKKATVKADDLEKYFKQAQFKMPAKLSQVLIDAKAAGYFDSLNRGEYKLNAVGYNLVAHSMPTSSTGK